MGVISQKMQLCRRTQPSEVQVGKKKPNQDVFLSEARPPPIFMINPISPSFNTSEIGCETKDVPGTEDSQHVKSNNGQQTLMVSSASEHSERVETN